MQHAARTNTGRYVSRLTSGTLAVVMAGGRGERDGVEQNDFVLTERKRLLVQLLGEALPAEDGVAARL